MATQPNQHPDISALYQRGETPPEDVGWDDKGDASHRSSASLQLARRTQACSVWHILYLMGDAKDGGYWGEEIGSR